MLISKSGESFSLRISLDDILYNMLYHLLIFSAVRVLAWISFTLNFQQICESIRMKITMEKIAHRLQELSGRKTVTPESANQKLNCRDKTARAMENYEGSQII